MGLIASFQAANLLGKITLDVLLVAFIFNWLVFTMNQWGLYDTLAANDENKIGYGVWRSCNNQEPSAQCQDLDGWRLAWYGAFQAFVIVGFMGINVAFFFIVMAVFVPHCSGNKEITIGCAIASLVAAISYLIALIIFGVRFDETYETAFDERELGACFILAVFIVILALIAAVCAFLGAKGGASVGAADKGDSSQSQARAERRRKQEEERKAKKEEQKRREEQRQREKEEAQRKKEEEKKQKGEERQKGKKTKS